MREVLYCNECGQRLNLYVVGVCSRCHFDLTGEDPDRDAREARSTLQATESDSEKDGGVILYLSIGWCLFAVVCAARLYPR